MRRLQFIEIHEQRWFPSSLRDGVTDALQFGVNVSGLYGTVAPLLRRALDLTGSGASGDQSEAGRSVVDMCSGGGGPWAKLSRSIESPGIRIWLTDKYPNTPALEAVSAASENRIAFYPGSVDAMKVPVELKGLRTMFTSFHHFSPKDASAILRNAVEANEGIGIFEISQRTPATMGIVFAYVFLLSICTAWIRPFRWSRLLWTYLIPIIPLVLTFDGVVSCLRTYRPVELREMVDGLASEDQYQWETGVLSTGRVPITYLIGCPTGAVPEIQTTTMQ
jgi:hypothetical protein